MSAFLCSPRGSDRSGQRPQAVPSAARTRARTSSSSSRSNGSRKFCTAVCRSRTTGSFAAAICSWSTIGGLFVGEHRPVADGTRIEEVVEVRLAPGELDDLAARVAGSAAELRAGLHPVAARLEGRGERLRLESRSAHALAVGRVEAAERVTHREECRGSASQRS